MGSTGVTPMMQQYLSIKEQHQDAILFYRMGDFYEMFFEDARTAAPVLEIALTSRNKNDTDPIPMCGVPVKAADGYIGRLIENGFKVAVCEQTEDPAAAKGLVRRAVVRIVTPGMIIDNALLENKTNNYVLSLTHADGVVGFASVDISTGTFRVCESSDLRAVRHELLRIAPREVVIPESGAGDAALSPFVSLFPPAIRTTLADREFDYRTACQRLTDQFQTRSLEGFGCRGLKPGIAAAGALLSYVNDTQKQKASHLTGLEVYSIDQYLLMDEVTCRNLELVANLRNNGRQGTLIDVLDACVTAMGSRLLRRWMLYPLLSVEAINQRLDAVAEAKEGLGVRKAVRELLKQVYDIERLTSRAVMGRATPRDLLALTQTLFALPGLSTELAAFASPLFSFDGELESGDMEKLAGLADLLESAVREDAPVSVADGGVINPDYHPRLAELVTISRDGKSSLARLEATEKEKTGISTLKVRYNKVFGYYIEVPRSQVGAVPAHYVRKQTLVNGERYITDELKTFEEKALGAEDQRIRLEQELFADIVGRVTACSPMLFAAARVAARIDVLCALAQVADDHDYIRPEMLPGGEIIIEDGRHPVVERMLSGERYVPNSITLNDTDRQLLIITGPNMAGKSTVLRKVALFSVMAQMGSFVPARRAAMGVVDRLFTRVGALDNLASGQSTFMVEMEETANIINNATPQSLVVIDEIGRGTSTYDGLSIAWAVAEALHDLHDRGVKTLFATHYHELTELENTRARVKNFHIAVKEWNDTIIFLRKLVEGSTNRSYGIQVARLAGIPGPVIARAKKVLLDIEQGTYSFESRPPEKQKGAPAGPVQLSLFTPPEQMLVDRLKKIDISTMTPLEALNCLHEMQQKANDISETDG